MNASRLAVRACAGFAILVGCDGSQAPIDVTGAILQSRALANHAEGGGSRILQQTQGDDLLYATSKYGGLFYYSYPRLELIGEITVNASAAGLCAVVPGKVCKIGGRSLPGNGAVAVQLLRYEAQAKGPNGISQPHT